MAINLNRVTITGHLARDPVLNGLPSGKSVCEMTVACNRKWQDKLTGEWEEWVDYIKVRAADSLAALAHEHLRRGSGVAVDGRLASQPADCEDPEHPLELLVLAEEMQLIPTSSTDALPAIDTPMAIELPHTSTPFASSVEH
jgi:single stranded DNA-binding protein